MARVRDPRGLECFAVFSHLRQEQTNSSQSVPCWKQVQYSLRHCEVLHLHACTVYGTSFSKSLARLSMCAWDAKLCFCHIMGNVFDRLSLCTALDSMIWFMWWWWWWRWLIGSGAWSNGYSCATAGVRSSNALAAMFRSLSAVPSSWKFCSYCMTTL